MKIVDVRASVHAFETKLPLVDKPAGDSLRIVCEVETDTGITGIGMAARFLPHGVVSAVVEHLRPAVIGMDPRDLERIHARLHRLVSERGQTIGINLSALSCIDIALWDILGKSQGCSVAQLLGGARDSVGAYVTFGFGAYDRDQLVEMARRLHDEGHRGFKMLVGVSKGGIHEDATRVRHLRDALGPDVLLAIDANESLSLDHALRLTRLIEDCDIAWFEDPVERCDPRNMAHLRRHTSIPIAAGQMDGHSSRFRAFVEAEAIDIFLVNSLYNGGVTETRRVAALSQIYDKPLSDAGGGGIFSLHHVAGFRNGTLAECHLGVEQVERQLFLSIPEIEDGRLRVPDAPGFGVTLNRDALRDSLVRPGD